jgi:hypothetical protein
VTRIADDELEMLKRVVSLPDLVQASGVELRRHGTSWLGQCPSTTITRCRLLSRLATTAGNAEVHVRREGASLSGSCVESGRASGARSRGFEA